MKSKTIFQAGIIGSIIAAVCCFTPVLVILFGALGLSTWLGWNDLVLLPALAIFIVITVYGLWRYRQNDEHVETSANTKTDN
ncbi:MAG: mercury resistance system transport protein MerF [Wenzhouxiangellaceae bacterium]|nr:mercury resistance system transport protein MerF [Wenzhouxiangellaceae bacterium]